MHRRRAGAPYEAACEPTMTKAADRSCPPRHTSSKTNEFLDLHVDMHDRATKSSAAKSILGVSKVPLLQSTRSSKTTTTSAVNPPSLVMMMPSATPNGLKRCQSASTIRKKLQHAMDQSAQSNQDQIAALRSLSATAIAKTTPKSLLLHNQRTASSTSPLFDDPQHSKQLHRTPSEAAVSKPSYATMFAESAAISGGVRRPSSAASGTFKSSSIELEVQLAERLNEIERSKLNEKVESRFRASQRAFQQVIQQDEAFGRILTSIRDEYDAYIAFLTHNTRVAGTSGCQCSHGSIPNNQTRDGGYDVANVRQENLVLKKKCSSMQREIDVLQASILAAAVQRGKTPLQPEDDSWSEDEEELNDVLLLPVANATMEPAPRPSIIPPLDFASLSPYNEEEVRSWRLDEPSHVSKCDMLSQKDEEFDEAEGEI